MSAAHPPDVFDAESADLNQLLRAMRRTRRPVRILSHGQPVAELVPIDLKRFGPADPDLRAEMLVPGHELTSEQDWPDEPR